MSSFKFRQEVKEGLGFGIPYLFFNPFIELFGAFFSPHAGQNDVSGTRVCFDEGDTAFAFVESGDSDPPCLFWT